MVKKEDAKSINPSIEAMPVGVPILFIIILGLYWVLSCSSHYYDQTEFGRYNLLEKIQFYLLFYSKISKK